jgi:hypothetical protein
MDAETCPGGASMPSLLVIPAPSLLDQPEIVPVPNKNRVGRASVQCPFQMIWSRRGLGAFRPWRKYKED